MSDKLPNNEGDHMATLNESTGIIVVPPFINLSSGSLNISHGQHDNKVLFFLAYFQAVAVCNYNTFMGIPGGLLISTELEQTLVSQGIIKPTGFRWFKQKGQFGIEQASDIAEQLYR